MFAKIINDAFNVADAARDIQPNTANPGLMEVASARSTSQLPHAREAFICVGRGSFPTGFAVGRSVRPVLL